MGNPLVQELPTETKVLQWQSLTLQDRCDRCSAQAFVAAHNETSSLHFCGHHFNKHEAAIIGAGFEIQDERDRINDKPSISANAE